MTDPQARLDRIADTIEQATKDLDEVDPTGQALVEFYARWIHNAVALAVYLEDLMRKALDEHPDAELEEQLDQLTTIHPLPGDRDD